MICGRCWHTPPWPPLCSCREVCDVSIMLSSNANSLGDDRSRRTKLPLADTYSALPGSALINDFIQAARALCCKCRRCEICNPSRSIYNHQIWSSRPVIQGCSRAPSLGFQNWTRRPRRLVLLLRDFLLSSLSRVTSIDSLLRSPWELLMSRLRLTKLDRLRPNAADETDSGRGSRSVGCDMRA